ncbi:hypothetical protein [Hallella multisaccharivorax]|nr:hypothetical protein [Hallella multisaccharivorax]
MLKFIDIYPPVRPLCARIGLRVGTDLRARMELSGRRGMQKQKGAR